MTFVPAWPGQVCSLGYTVGPLIESDLGIELTDEQAGRVIEFWRLDPVTGARVVRRAALRRPKGAGKSPEAGYCGYAELVLPTRFSHFDAGQPVGIAHPDPWVQFAAVSEDQTDNVMVWLYDVLAAREETCRLRGIDLGRTRIYLFNRPGRIEPVTAAAGSREGQRVTFAALDQTEAWTKENGGTRLAATLRRNVGKMSGWSLELQNAPHLGDGSVADMTGRASAQRARGVLFDTREPPGAEDVDLADTNVLRPMLEFAYGESKRWVDLGRIVDEIQDPDTDPSDARRYFLNVAAPPSGWAFDRKRWKALATTDGDTSGPVTLGIKGARFRDAVAVIATAVESGYQWTVGIWERPDKAPDNYEHPLSEVDAAVTEFFEHYPVWRAYVDPQNIEHLVDGWAGRFDDKRIIAWYTNRPRQIAYAVRAFRSALSGGDLSHDGDEVLARHVGNARRQPLNVKDDEGKPMWSMQKERPGSPLEIAGAMAAVLSWEARGDAIAAGVLDEDSVYETRGLVTL